jgi:hypothetical protein
VNSSAIPRRWYQIDRRPAECPGAGRGETRYAIATELPGDPVAPLMGTGFNLVRRHLFQVEVLVDDDAVHRDPDRMTGERDVGVLAGHGLDRPGVAADDRDLPLGEPLADRRSRPRTAFVVLGLVFLPRLRVAGPEEHRVALAGLADPLPRERRAHMLGMARPSSLV